MPSLFPQCGPSLPPFSSLLITGDYHPSAPIYLCLSSISEFVGPGKAILISSSRQSLKATLEHHNDEWLKVNSGNGSTTSSSSRVQLFYPPSPAHLCYLLSMLTVPRSPHPEMDTWLNDQTTLAATPILIILHEPSVYFLTNDHNRPRSSWTLSSYLSLVTHALTCASFLSNNAQSMSVSFALFDSRLETLRLPMVKSPTPHHTDDYEAQDPRLEHVYAFVQKYFEWRIISSEEATPLSWNGRRKRCMTLHRTNRVENPVKLWTWWEGPKDDSVENDKQATCLFWDC
ncbi:hypothetical protein H2248_006192 [Termitomyces sp. 'cryptogamus']|nr:hypothetical protein H2248_006192 [Termitomyces sp. 'cryptogamus']